MVTGRKTRRNDLEKVEAGRREEPEIRAPDIVEDEQNSQAVRTRAENCFQKLPGTPRATI